MRYCFLLILVFQFYKTTGQQFGGNPPAHRFYELKSDTVNVLYPKGLEKEAREIMSISNQLIKNPPASLGVRIRPIHVVLQNLPVQSNAYVGIAPRRSEYYMRTYFANHELSSLPWHQVLAVHETRHIHQFDVFNTRIPRFLSFFLGQQGAALGMNAAIPDWFWEGDAVWQESVVTTQGRGRLPYFFNGYRSLWYAGKKYNYQQLRNGSFRKYIPNHYELGYLLVHYGRQRFGDTIWRNITKDAIGFKGLVYPFQKAVKRHTGLSYKSFVDSSFSFYKNQMKIEHAEKENDHLKISNAVKNNVQFYRFPTYMMDGSRLTLLESYRTIPRWVIIDSTGKQRKKTVKDIDVESYYSLRGNNIVYTAFKPDLRWGWREYSNIKIMNIASGKRRNITIRSRFFMPDLSPDQKSIAAVYSGSDLKCSLTLIGIDDQTQTNLPNPNNYIYTYPKFSSDGKNIYSAIRNEKGEMAILQTNCSTGSEVLLFPFANRSISYLHVSDDYIFFTSPESRSDIIYRLSIEDKNIVKVADLTNGNYQPSYRSSKTTLLFNTWTADGLMLREQALNEFNPSEKYNPRELELLFTKDSINYLYPNALDQVQHYPGISKKYRQGLHLLNIHSWRPRVYEPDYGITFYSDNILNTFSGELNYNYNRNESSHQLSTAMLYGGLYPLLRAELSQTWNRSFSLNQDTLITWNQQGMNAGFVLPFNFTGGRNFRNLSIRANIHNDKIQYTGLAKSIYANDDFRYYSTALSWVQQSQKAVQQIYPRWAHTFFLQHRHTLDGIKGGQLFVNASLYLPGLSNNHHLVLFASWQGRDTLRGSRFSNSIPFARGYNPINFPRSQRISANYHLPLFYPELGVGQLIYFLRVRSNFFFDYLQGKSLRTGRKFPLRSAGAEIFFDTRFWNQVPVSFGFRYSRLLDNDLLQPTRNPNQFEFILPLDLF